MDSYLSKWESEIYGKGKQLSKYTWGEIYYYTNRYFIKDGSSVDVDKLNVLEIGSGTGNNLIYFAQLGMNVYGIEGSKTASNISREKLAEFKNINSEVVTGDFCQSPLPFDDNFFDLIIDRGAIASNFLDNIKVTISECFRMLKKNAMMFTIHFYSDKCDSYGKGRLLEPNTYADVGGSTFEDVPVMHFTNVNEIKQLYKGFCIEHLSENIKRIFLPGQGELVSTFDIIVTKR